MESNYKVDTWVVKKMVWVTFQRRGFHYYADAPDDVDYLKFRHRHLFKFRIGFEVTHDNRELEFHQELNWLESLFGTEIDIDGKSCEMLAADIHKHIVVRHGLIAHTVEVAEDGECGATVEYIPGV